MGVTTRFSERRSVYVEHHPAPNGSELSGLYILFGCAPEVWQDVMSKYHASSERIGQEIVLSPLTVDDVNQLIEAYLGKQRTGSTTGRKLFSEEVVELILQRSQGNIRQILSVCIRVLDQAVDNCENDIPPTSSIRFWNDTGHRGVLPKLKRRSTIRYRIDGIERGILRTLSGRTTETGR